jgi:cytochrome c553
MKKTLIKISMLVLFLILGATTLFFSLNASKAAFASDIVIAHLHIDSKELPTGAKAKMTLGKDSTKEHGEVAFDHDTHSFKKYSPDGKTDIGCAECHHTDQPKSALKPPLVTSERKEVLTVESLKKPDAPVVKSCRSCHFQKGNVPDDKEQAVMGAGDDIKEIDNEIAYHNNCNVCHDAAAKLRPDLKKKPNFATSDRNDCFKCHKKQ